MCKRHVADHLEQPDGAPLRGLADRTFGSQHLFASFLLRGRGFLAVNREIVLDVGRCLLRHASSAPAAVCTP